MLRNRESVGTKLQRIAEKARNDPKCKFTSLFHLMNEELLRGCFEGLRKDAASGIDKVTKEEYGKDLEANLDLTGRAATQDVVHTATGAQSVYPEAGKHEAEAVGDSGPGRQASAGGTGTDTGSDL